ncbi:Vascular endothelial growth factor receptor 2 [Balamuthia mandrillaris]
MNTLALLIVLLFAWSVYANWSVKEKTSITTGQGGLNTVIYPADPQGWAQGEYFGWSVCGLGPQTESGPSLLAVGAPSFKYNDRTPIDTQDWGIDREGTVFILALNETGYVETESHFLWPSPSYDEFGSGCTVVPQWHQDGRAGLLVQSSDRNVWPSPLGTNGAFLGGPQTSLSNSGTVITFVGDVDGDGVGDLAVGDPQDGKLRILFMNANGTIESTTTITEPGGPSPPQDPYDVVFASSLAGVGDINGDGVPDLVVGLRYKDNTRGTIMLLMLNRTGGVADWHEFTLQDFASQAEYDALNQMENARFGWGLSGLGAPVPGITSDEFLESGDWNHDNVPDFAVACLGLGRVWIAFMNADGTLQSTFAIQGQFQSFGFSISPLGDLNLDGVPDIAIGNPGEASQKGVVHVHLLDALKITMKNETVINSTLVVFTLELSASPSQDVVLPFQATYQGPLEGVQVISTPPSPLVFPANTSELSVHVALSVLYSGNKRSTSRQESTIALSFENPLNAFLSPSLSLPLSFVMVDPPEDGNTDGDEDGQSSNDSSNGSSDVNQGNKSEGSDEVGAEVIAPVVVIGLLLLVAVAAVLIYFVWRTRRVKRDTAAAMEHNDLEAVYAAPTGSQSAAKKKRRATRRDEDAPGWDIEYSELEFEEEIGRGTLTERDGLTNRAFGVVWKATWRNSEVAVKKLNTMDEHEQQEFQAEALLMKGLRPHANVVQLMGICSEVSTPFCIVTEFLPMGDLLSYVLKNADSIDNQQMIRWAVDIAAGMGHLHHEGITHRDLAARNLLLTAELRVKVSDFGLSRKARDGGAHKTQSEIGPLKWMAPEAIQDQIYSEKSDVWSYGVCLWEIVTRGEEPFKGMAPVKAALHICERGIKLDIPESAPTVLAEIITQCWATQPEERPTFKEIGNMLKAA